MLLIKAIVLYLDMDLWRKQVLTEPVLHWANNLTENK